MLSAADKEFNKGIRAWVKALRSRKFKQGTKTLKRHVGNGKFEYCCLGVLAAIDPDAEAVPEYWDRKNTIFFVDKDKIGEDDFNPSGLYRYGLTDEQQRELIRMNDDEGKSFRVIANWIEQNLIRK